MLDFTSGHVAGFHTGTDEPTGGEFLPAAVGDQLVRPTDNGVGMLGNVDAGEQAAVESPLEAISNTVVGVLECWVLSVVSFAGLGFDIAAETVVVEAVLDAGGEPVRVADELSVEDADALRLELAVKATVVDAGVGDTVVCAKDNVENGVDDDAFDLQSLRVSHS